MVSLTTPVCDFGAAAVDFELLGVDGLRHSLDALKGEKGTVIAFISNHCPYVKAIRQRLIQDALDLKPLGVSLIAICSNDAQNYPEDSYESMRIVATQFNYPFVYLHDADQQVAKAYGAVCTPDFFGYNDQLQLQYRGRLDASHKKTAPEGTRRDLFEAMRQVSVTGKGPSEQIPSMGCSIKWLSED